MLVRIFSGSILLCSLFSNAQQKIVGGGSHTFIICEDSSGNTWGANYSGQLGNGTTTTTGSPVAVTTIGGIEAVAAGWEHSMALLNDGTVWAWGENSYGQLGDSSTVDRYDPVKVKVISDITSISWGHIHTHSLAVKSDGSVWAWGYNPTGKLGDNTLVSKDAPIQVHGLSNVGFLSNIIAVAGGHDFSLALEDDGTAWAWGANGFGQLGDGTTTQRITPVPVVSLTNATAIVVGDWHSMALKDDGTVWTWGYGGGGRLGINSMVSSSSPVQVHGYNDVGFLTDVVKIAAGETFCLVLKSDGTVWGWGRNDVGQLGDGTAIDRWTPIQIPGLSDVVEIGAGARHSVVLKSDGTVWTFGDNGYGQLGDGTLTNSFDPIQVVGHCDMPSTTGAGIKNSEEEVFGVFPNPTDGKFTMGSLEGTLTICNLAGEVIVSSITSNSELMDISGFPAGMYLLTLSTETGIFQQRLLLR